MARQASPTITDSERRVLDVLWRHGQSSVRDVVDNLSQKGPVAYTTVLTIFKILEKKNLVEYRREGRAFIYKAKITRTEARKKALENLLRQFFNGSPNILAQLLIDEHNIDAMDLQALQEKVDASQERISK